MCVQAGGWWSTGSRLRVTVRGGNRLCAQRERGGVTNAESSRPDGRETGRKDERNTASGERQKHGNRKGKQCQNPKGEKYGVPNPRALSAKRAKPVIRNSKQTCACNRKQEKAPAEEEDDVGHLVWILKEGDLGERLGERRRAWRWRDNECAHHRGVPGGLDGSSGSASCRWLLMDGSCHADVDRRLDVPRES